MWHKCLCQFSKSENIFRGKNGSKRGHVYKFLRSQGFVSSYDTAHHYTDADAHKWVSHRNHRGNIWGVDYGFSIQTSVGKCFKQVGVMRSLDYLSWKKSGKGKRPGKGAFINFAVAGVVDYEMLGERVMNFRSAELTIGPTGVMLNKDHGNHPNERAEHDGFDDEDVDNENMTRFQKLATKDGTVLTHIAIPGASELDEIFSD
ncbi:hypothetical protein Tco_0868197 [Tanacetum coccineum]